MVPIQALLRTGCAKLRCVIHSSAGRSTRFPALKRRPFLLSGAALVVLALYASAAFALPLLPPVMNTTAFPGTTSVGSTTTQTITVTFTAAGTPSTVEALTTGVTGLDFSVLDPESCSTTSLVALNGTCTFHVQFKPQYPGRRDGAIRVRATDGTVLGQQLITARGTGPLPVLKPGEIDTVAGSIGWSYLTDNVLATQAYIFTPKSAAIDGAGNLYIADTGNSRIRMVAASNKFISTYAGTGSPAFNGNNLQALTAAISSPAGLVLDGAGNLYFSDRGNSIVRRIDAVTKVVSTVAGTPLVPGSLGDGGLATLAQLNLPEALAFDQEGDLLIADSGNNEIRKVDATTGVITTIAGDRSANYLGEGLQAKQSPLYNPTGVAVGADDSVYIADFGNQRVRRIASDGTLNTVAGNGTQGFAGDGGSAKSAELNLPAGVALDPAGNLYIADSGNNRVRFVNKYTGSIETLTGGDSEGFYGDGLPANQATFYGPYGLFVAPAGDVYITDMFHMRVRRISASSLSLAYPVMRVGKTSTPQNAGLINDGDQPLLLSSPVFSQSALDAPTSTCFQGSATLPSGGECGLGVEFAPTQVGNPINGTLDLPSNAIYVTPEIQLHGQVLSVNPTTVAVTTLAPSTNPSIVGDTVTLQAKVTSDDTGRTGTVSFSVDGVASCSAVTLSAAGTANCAVGGLLLGPHTVLASYSGDAQNAASVSLPYTQVVKQRATLLLTSSAPTVVITKPVTFVVTVSAATGVPTGTVNFFDGATQVGTGTLDAQGSASLTLSNLLLGAHSITVQYVGDATNAALTSAALAETVRLGATTTAVGSSNSAIAVGVGLNLQATVASLDGLAPTGAVLFKNGSTVLGTATLQADGTATLPLLTLSVGNYSIVATYSGDTDNATSSSAALPQTSSKLATVTTLTTSAATLNAGASLQLTAETVLGPGQTAYGAIGGTVTFSDNGKTLGTATMAADGSANFTVLSLSVGTHTLTATYGGSTNYASSSGTSTQAVIKTASNIVLTAAASTVLAGKPAQFVVNVSSSTGFPTGTVVFQEGSATVGTATLAKGVATFSTTSLPAGPHTITAVYQGDSNYLEATSTPVTEVVQLAQTSLALTGPGSPVVVTTAADFAAALSTEGVAPTGTLTLLDGSTPIATQHLTAAGSFLFHVSTLSVGTHTLTAQYGGDANNATATSAAITVQVVTAATTTTMVSSVNPVVLGKEVDFTAKVSSAVANLTGTVTLLENGNVLGTAPLQNGVVVMPLTTLPFGRHTLVASYSGDAQHSASASVALVESVIEPATVNLASSLNPSISGQVVTLSATVPGTAGMVPTGTITFQDGATVLATMTLNASGQAQMQTTTLSVGMHTITAVYSGDSNFSAGQASLSQLVKISTTTVTETVSANPATYGVVTDLTATVKSDGGVATGQVRFTEGGAVLGSAVLDASGVAVLHLGTLHPGPHSVMAVYAGDGKAGPSASSPMSFLVKQLTTLTLASSANPALTLDHVVVTATLQNSNAAVATGNVVFSDGSTVIGTGVLSPQGTATLNIPPMTAGAHSITATYAGDDGDFPANAPALAQTVNLRSTQTSVSASSTSLTDPQQVTVVVVVQSLQPSAVALPGGKVTLYSSGIAIGTVTLDSNGAGTFTTRQETGETASYSAKYGGDASYSGSTSGTTKYSTGSVAAQFTLAVSNTAPNVARAQHTTVTVSAASLKGFSDNLKLGCVGLPYAATCTFTTMKGDVSTSMMLPSNGSGTMQLTIDTGDPLGGGSETSASLRRSVGGGAVLCFVPFCLWMFKPSQRRRLLPLLLVVLAFALTMGVSGCGGLKVNSTPAGTYTFQVTAVGQGSGISESQTVTLTVGQ